jgi:plasmid stabilization system protein ParE
MTDVIFSPQVEYDLARIFDFLDTYAPDTAVRRIQDIVDAMGILASSPGIGRPASRGQRELLISTGSGYLALYAYNPVANEALVLAIKSQRERGYTWKLTPSS